MALQTHLVSPLFSAAPATLSGHKLARRISCTAGDGGFLSDAALASELAVKAARINNHMLKAEEAMRKSRKLLFVELCEHMGLNEDEAQQKWTKMAEDEKWALVKGFLTEWGAHFHPLSARSTKDMLEEYIKQRNAPPPPPSKSPSSSFLFSGLNRIIGF